MYFNIFYHFQDLSSENLLVSIYTIIESTTNLMFNNLLLMVIINDTKNSINAIEN